MKRALAAALIVLGVFLMASAPAHATNNPHKVWVCKYVGAPGDYEQLKAGKQPIQVDVSAADDYVGADFADGQTHSVVIDLVTAENTDDHNDYIGEATCPTAPSTTTTTESPTTSTSVPDSTTTSTVPETTTSVVDPSTTTQPEASTTTLPPETTTTAPADAPSTTTTQVPESSTTTVAPTTTTSLPPSTSSSVPVPSSTVAVTSTTQPPATSTPPEPPTGTPSVPSSLPYTGTDTGPWLLVGFLCLCAGLALILSTRSYRKTHPWEA